MSLATNLARSSYEQTGLFASKLAKENEEYTKRIIPRLNADMWRRTRITMNAIEAFEAKQLKAADSIPTFRPGDTVKVNVKIQEGNNSRIQAFQGVVIGRQGAGLRETFIVRKVSFGVGVERRFPVHSPSIDSIELVRKGKVRRAKLYYLRNLRGKAARIVERRDNSAK